jgi:hypothetical protein
LYAEVPHAKLCKKPRYPEEVIKNIHKVVIAAATLLVAFSAVWIWLARESEIGGDDFKKLVVESDRKTYSSWYLYYEDRQKYCLEFSHPVVPARYCVPKSDLDVRNSEGGKTSKNGYVGMGDFVLKANRRPGLTEEVF